MKVNYGTIISPTHCTLIRPHPNCLCLLSEMFYLLPCIVREREGEGGREREGERGRERSERERQKGGREREREGEGGKEGEREEKESEREGGRVRETGREGEVINTQGHQKRS